MVKRSLAFWSILLKDFFIHADILSMTAQTEVTETETAQTEEVQPILTAEEKAERAQRIRKALSDSDPEMRLSFLWGDIQRNSVFMWERHVGLVNLRIQKLRKQEKQSPTDMGPATLEEARTYLKACIAHMKKLSSLEALEAQVAREEEDAALSAGRVRADYVLAMAARTKQLLAERKKNGKVVLQMTRGPIVKGSWMNYKGINGISALLPVVKSNSLADLEKANRRR